MQTVLTMQPSSQLEGESPIWYTRFITFLALGAGRTAVAVWRGEVAEGHRRRALPGNWRRATGLYRWFERASAYDLQRARETLLQLENRELDMRMRDLDEINLLYEELDRLKAELRDKPPTARSFLGITRATNALHRLTDKALNRLAKYRGKQAGEERAKPVLLPMPNIPAFFNKPRLTVPSPEKIAHNMHQLGVPSQVSNTDQNVN